MTSVLNNALGESKTRLSLTVEIGIQPLNNLITCIDGRAVTYKPDYAAAKAIPGASVGLLLNVKALLGTKPEYQSKFSDHDLINLISETTEMPFVMHSDEACVKSCRGYQRVFGCAHLLYACVNYQRYLLSQSDSEEIPKNLHYHPKKLVFDCFAGEHAEKALVIVESKTHTVAPAKPDDQIFVWDKLAHWNLLKRVAIKVCPLIRMDACDGFERLKEIAKIQAGVTFGSLLQNKPHFPEYKLKINSYGEIL